MMVMMVLAVRIGFSGPGASGQRWRRESENMSARTCATAFTRRLFYLRKFCLRCRGTPGKMQPAPPTANGHGTISAGS